MKATIQLLGAWEGLDLTAMNLDDSMVVLAKRETTAPEIIVADYRLPGGATGVGAATHLQLILGAPFLA